MIFNYTRKNGDKLYKAFFDITDIQHGTLVESEEGNVLVLTIRGMPVENVSQIPHYKPNRKTGQMEIDEYRPTKLLQQPVIEITVQEEIDRFLELTKDNS